MQLHHVAAAASAEMPTSAQRLFVRYFIAITIDLIVLGLLAEVWDQIMINHFSTVLFAAVLLQLLLQLTLVVEHKAAGMFQGKSGTAWKLGRFLVAWFILFSSKFVMLWAVYWFLGDNIEFRGAMHGAVAFIVAVVAMVVAEEIVNRIFRALGRL